MSLLSHGTKDKNTVTIDTKKAPELYTSGLWVPLIVYHNGQKYDDEGNVYQRSLPSLSSTPDKSGTQFLVDVVITEKKQTKTKTIPVPHDYFVKYKAYFDSAFGVKDAPQRH
jgi:hypothetical protein